ncbi:MAG: type II restriction endonuclease [Candidatus Pacebacteria bacterium]|nr:type II restriction endonuclease [Candidatus Paceibacterota bacterium]
MKSLQFQAEKLRFITNLQQLITKIDLASQDAERNWLIKGFIDRHKNLYALSHDTKVISKIIEIQMLPHLTVFAEENGYNLILPEHQNYYPDLSFQSKDDLNILFALDIKTTFRKKDKASGFTLGSHGGYFKDRKNRKNIQFPYEDYIAHFCLGVIYSRNESSEADITNNSTADSVYRLENLEEIRSVIKDLDFFVAEKWKIASDSRGSGNTANIGSITDIADLKNSQGVFSKLGEDWFDEYWMNYGKVRLVKNGDSILVTNIWDFLRFKGREDLFSSVNSKGAKVIK